MDHELKIWPQYYKRVSDGTKTFEVRNNDRDFQMGDSVTLREYDPEPMNGTVPGSPPKGYTDSPLLKFNIGFVFVLDQKTVVFSLLPIKKIKS